MFVKRSVGVVVGSVAAAALLLAGCQSQTPPTSTIGAKRPVGGGQAGGQPKVTSKPKATIAVNLSDGAKLADGAKNVRPDATVKVEATGGLLTDVAVTGKDGSKVSGTFDAAKKAWTAASDTRLTPSTSYTLTAEAVNSDGAKTTTSQTFTTLSPSSIQGTDITPIDNQTVGVGMPIIVKFDHAVKDKAKAEKQLTVETSKPVEGAWHWFSDREVHYRPKAYWPGGIKVTVHLDLKGVDTGGGAWGIRDKTKTFTIARSVVTKVNLHTHFAKVYLDGSSKPARTIPVTGGKPGWETRNGIKVIVAKQLNKHFTNEQIDAKEDYDLWAKYAMRVTWSGEFLHTAAWSTGSQGRANVSHGCVGMNTENSKWLYGITHIGDPVEVSSNGPQMPVWGNGYGDWNMSWSKWKAGSALAS